MEYGAQAWQEAAKVKSLGRHGPRDRQTSDRAEGIINRRECTDLELSAQGGFNVHL